MSKWVCLLGISVTQPNLSLFNIYMHKSTLLTKYYLILSSTELYWPSTTMYLPAPPHSDPVPPSNSNYRPSNGQWSPLDLFLAHLIYHTQYTWSSYITFSYFSLSPRLLAAPLKFNCKIFWGVFQRTIAWMTCSKALKKAVNFLDTAAIKPVHCPRVHVCEQNSQDTWYSTHITQVF